jgi:hypothetical protein
VSTAPQHSIALSCIQHGLWMFGRDLEENTRRTLWPPPLLFPISQRRHTDTEQTGKLLLSEPVVLPDRESR